MFIIDRSVCTKLDVLQNRSIRRLID